MGNNDRRPKIRFKGFNDDWEQHEFGEIFKLSQGLQIPISKRYLEKATNRYFYITNEFLKDSCEKVYYIESPAENVICTKDDILMTRTGNTGIVITDVEGCFHNNFFKIQYNKDLFSKNYICYLLKSEKMKKKILNSAGSSTIPDLSHKSFYKIDAKFPILKEQYKIGEFFKQLDSLIVLHQRKLEKLGNIKKSMLEKMFPKDENKVPEIRFKGFNDDWEQRYIEDIASFSKGNGYSKSDLSNNGNPIILYGRLYTNYEFCIDKVNTYSKIKKGSVLSQGNEVIVPSSGETSEDIARASAIIKKGILIGGDLNIIRPIEIVESCFLALAISNGKTQKDLSSKAQGKSVVHIHNSDIKKIQVSFPKVKEQEKIIKLFKFIDNLISLHQRKLEKLKNIKKACLEKMFV